MSHYSYLLSIVDQVKLTEDSYALVMFSFISENINRFDKFSKLSKDFKTFTSWENVG